MSYSPANPFDYLMSGGFRSYNAVPSKQDTFVYAFNPYYDNGNGKTGQMQLMTTDNQGALRVNVGTGISVSASLTGGSVTVNNTAPIPVSGVFQATVNPTTFSKVSSSGYVSSFSPLSGPSVVSKIQGISTGISQPQFILVYDGATGAGNFPVASVPTQPNNAWFIDLSENGVAFNSGIVVTNSTNGISVTQAGLGPDFFSTIIYR